MFGRLSWDLCKSFVYSSGRVRGPPAVVKGADVIGLATGGAAPEVRHRSENLRTALLDSAGHDLKSAFAVILGSATTLMDYRTSLDDAAQHDLLAMIRDEAERMNRYVGNLLQMTRLDGGAIRPMAELTDLNDVLSCALRRVGPRAARRQLVRNVPNPLAPVPTDPVLLEQVFFNILDNVCAYSPDGSTVSVTIQETSGATTISIEDEGRGIPPSLLHHVFERFRQLEEPAGRRVGSGLGLAIAKGFIDAMGGRIAAASPVHSGGGTLVLITLPSITVSTDL